MELVFTFFLVLHVLGGSIGLLSGTLNILRKKGEQKHQRTGRLFVYSMLTAGFSSFILSLIHPNYFLFMVGVFTVYLVGTGNRYIYLKLLGSKQRPGLVDKAITYGMLVAGVLFVVFGIKNLFNGNTFGIVFIAFGSLGLRFVKTDLANYKGEHSAKNYWLLAHLQRMIAAYISALTAFLVVNAQYLLPTFPSVVVWLIPTVLFTPLILFWSKKYIVQA